jgi:transposase
LRGCLHFPLETGGRLKILIWDGSGLILIYKRLDDAKFRWPRIEDGIMRLSPAQASALFEGLDWARVRAVRKPPPQAVQ